MFKTKEEIDQYFSTDKIQCLICGKEFYTLGTHLLMKHNISVDEYKEKFGLPWGKGLAGKIAREKSAKHARNLIQTGVVTLNHSPEYMKKLHTQYSTQRPHCPANKRECIDKCKPFLDKFNKEASEKRKQRIKREKAIKEQKKQDKEIRDQQIIELRKTNSIAEIVKQTGFSNKVVKTVLKNNGLTKTKNQVKLDAQKMREKVVYLRDTVKMKHKDIAVEVGLSQVRVQQILSR